MAPTAHLDSGPMKVPYERFTIEVEGQQLVCGRWGSGDQVAVASHGITANHLSWQLVGEQLGELSGVHSLVAIDHRGRAGSAAAAGPFGLATHADDVVAVLNHLGLDSAPLVGHSMGGFVVATAAERHQARVERLILVDGGLPFPFELPTDVDVEEVVRSVIGPALDRLDQRWPDVEAYLELFRGHPAFVVPNEWTTAAEAYVRYDAVTTDGGMIRSSVNKEAVLVDGGAAIVDPSAAASIERISTAATLLWAPRGILDQKPGLYTAAHVEQATARLAHLDARLVDDSNHYTITVGHHGARTVAEAIVD